MEIKMYFKEDDILREYSVLLVKLQLKNANILS